MASLKTKIEKQPSLNGAVTTSPASGMDTTVASSVIHAVTTGQAVTPPPPVVIPPAATALSDAPDAIASAKYDEDLAAYKKLCQEQYDRYTGHLWDQRHESQSEADKLVVTLASASLGLSMGFIKDVVPLAHSVLLPLLFLSWLGFGASIISTLVSHYLSIRTVNDHIGQCEAYFFEEKRDAFDGAKKGARATEDCNRVSAITFVIGLALVLSFIGINVWKENYRLSDKTQTAKMVKPQHTPGNDGVAPFGGTPPQPPVLPKQPTPAASATKPSAGTQDTKK